MHYGFIYKNIMIHSTFATIDCANQMKPTKCIHIIVSHTHTHCTRYRNYELYFFLFVKWSLQNRWIHTCLFFQNTIDTQSMHSILMLKNIYILLYIYIYIWVTISPYTNPFLWDPKMFIQCSYKYIYLFAKIFNVCFHTRQQQPKKSHQSPISNK